MTKIILTLLLSLRAFSSGLVPIPIKKQLNEAEGVVLAEYTGKTYKKNHEGKIITEATFRILKSAGISSRYLINQNHFSIYYHGGKWQGVDHENINAPTFAENSQYILLLDRDSFGFKPYYEKLGVYDYYGRADGLVLSSMAFPDHQELGNIPYRTFDLWVRTIYGSYLTEIHSNTFVSQNKKNENNRKTASYNENDKNSDSTSVNIIWFAIAFGVLGALRIRRVKTSK